MVNTNELEEWYEFNSNLIGIIVSLSFFMLIYFILNQDSRRINFSDYSEKVNLIDFDFEKSLVRKGFYSTEQKLNLVKFKLVYEYKGEVINSTSILFGEYISPEFETIIENKEIDKIEVLTKKDNPKMSIVRIKVHK